MLPHASPAGAGGSAWSIFAFTSLSRGAGFDHRAALCASFSPSGKPRLLRLAPPPAISPPRPPQCRDRLRLRKSRKPKKSASSAAIFRAGRESSQRDQAEYDAAGEGGGVGRDRRRAEEVHRQLRAGRPVVVAISHLGNWELFAQIVPSPFWPCPLGTVYQKLVKPAFDHSLGKQRARFGLRLFDRSAGSAKAIQLLRAGGMIGILSDQHAGDAGLWTPFFGRLASTSPLPACSANGLEPPSSPPRFTLPAGGSGGWFSVRRYDLPNDSVASLTAKTNRSHRRPDPACSGRLVLGPQPLENAEARLASDRLQARPFSAERQRRFTSAFRILIRASNWLGDSVISMPAVRAIKRGRPDAHVTILAPEKIAAVWRLVPEVDAVISSGKIRLGRCAGLCAGKQPFDVGIAFPNSFRSRARTLAGGVPRRCWLCRASPALALEPGGAKVGTKGAAAASGGALSRHCPLVRRGGRRVGEIAVASSPAPAGGRRIGLCPGAEYGPAKRWLPERFAETAAAIGGRVGAIWNRER